MSPDQPRSPEPLSREAEARHHRDILNELIDIGTEIARTLRPTPAQPAEGPAESPPQAAPHAQLTPLQRSEAFDQVSRAVRRAILLVRALDRPQTPAATSARAPAQDPTAARKLILRDVEDAINRNEGDADPNQLHQELVDRLDAPDLAYDLLTIPIADLVKNIYRDLGLVGSNYYKRRTPAEAAALHTRAANTPGNASGQGQPQNLPPIVFPTPAKNRAKNANAKPAGKPLEQTLYELLQPRTRGK